MIDYKAFAQFSPTTYADVLRREQVMNIHIRPLWDGMPRVAGPAFPVRCAAGDNLMVHAAIYRAPPHSILVVEAGDLDYAVAGGNVCAIAQQKGIVAFVVDGLIRDLAEARENQFPVFARGVIPIPGGKDKLDAFNQPVTCGGVLVHPLDVVIADEEGIVVVPHAQKEDVLREATLRAEKDTSQTLEEWESSHRTRIDAILKEKGFTDSGTHHSLLG
jgi:4-hydroxy-4-methyl-2-oxoglutarate aldolase